MGSVHTISALEERAQQFWAKQDELRAACLENPAIREAAFAALRADWERSAPRAFPENARAPIAAFGRCI